MLPTDVYTMDNQFGNNMIHAWEGTDSGSLKLLDRYPTGGSGFPRAPDGLPVSDVLASSFSVIRHENFVINVNPGSNSVSVFEIANDGRLERRSVTEIEGVFPVILPPTPPPPPPPPCVCVRVCVCVCVRACLSRRTFMHALTMWLQTYPGIDNLHGHCTSR